METNDGQGCRGVADWAARALVPDTLSSSLLSCPSPSPAPSPGPSCKQLPFSQEVMWTLSHRFQRHFSCLPIWFQSSHSIPSLVLFFGNPLACPFGIQPSILTLICLTLKWNVPALALGLWNLTIWAPTLPYASIKCVCVLGGWDGEGLASIFGLKNYNWFLMIREMHAETMNYHSHLPD